MALWDLEEADEMSRLGRWLDSLSNRQLSWLQAAAVVVFSAAAFAAALWLCGMVGAK